MTAYERPDPQQDCSTSSLKPARSQRAMRSQQISVKSRSMSNKDHRLKSVGSMPACRTVPSKTRTLDPVVKRLQCAITELSETENSYVQSLMDLEEGYLMRLRADAKWDSRTVDTIFGRIPDLHAFHRRLALELHNSHTNLTDVAGIFLKHAAQMEQLYADYCLNFDSSMHTLNMMQRGCAKFCARLVVLQHDLRHPLSVDTYLLKPVQRIMRYQLMLQECLKQCKNVLTQLTSSEDVDTLDGYDPTSKFGGISELRQSEIMLSHALTRMIRIAEYINQRKADCDLINHLGSLHLNMDDLGDLLLKGYFRVLGKKARRFVLLFHGAVVVCKLVVPIVPANDSYAQSLVTVGGVNEVKSEIRNSLEVHEVIRCDELMLIECIPKDPLAFHILPFGNPKSQHTLQAPSAEIKRVWCREMKRLILEHYNAAIPDKVKAIVLNMSESGAMKTGFVPSTDISDGISVKPTCSYSTVSRNRSLPLHSDSKDEQNGDICRRPCVQNSRNNVISRCHDSLQPGFPDESTNLRDLETHVDRTRTSTTDWLSKKPVNRSFPPTCFPHETVDSVRHLINRTSDSAVGSTTVITRSLSTFSTSSSTSASSTDQFRLDDTPEMERDFRCIAVDINEEQVRNLLGSLPVCLPHLSSSASASASLIQIHNGRGGPPSPSPSNADSAYSSGKRRYPRFSTDDLHISATCTTGRDRSKSDGSTTIQIHDQSMVPNSNTVTLSSYDLKEIFGPLTKIALTVDEVFDLQTVAEAPGNPYRPLSRAHTVDVTRNQFQHQNYYRTNPPRFESPQVNSVQAGLVNGNQHASDSGSSGASSPSRVVSRIALQQTRNTSEPRMLSKKIAESDQNVPHAKGTSHSLMATNGRPPATADILQFPRKKQAPSSPFSTSPGASTSTKSTINSHHRLAHVVNHSRRSESPTCNTVKTSSATNGSSQASRFNGATDQRLAVAQNSCRYRSASPFLRSRLLTSKLNNVPSPLSTTSTRPLVRRCRTKSRAPSPPSTRAPLAEVEKARDSDPEAFVCTYQPEFNIPTEPLAFSSAQMAPRRQSHAVHACTALSHQPRRHQVDAATGPVKPPRAMLDCTSRPSQLTDKPTIPARTQPVIKRQHGRNRDLPGSGIVRNMVHKFQH
ncbi:hypothetical protein EG68_04473 [Paragonimus skrjabini miyazakii]|uniref:DH domain-containing protein n=1 Tax=Paragonimus skrjabini miyazakii TaxID=59628 RepID=A0A8S9Z6J4_9TREM|nr:hypothetical protein EG68_04473 [Paragonimus skrjabini miyazakii]